MAGTGMPQELIKNTQMRGNDHRDFQWLAQGCLHRERSSHRLHVSLLCGQCFSAV